MMRSLGTYFFFILKYFVTLNLIYAGIVRHLRIFSQQKSRLIYSLAETVRPSRVQLPKIVVRYFIYLCFVGQKP